MRTNMLFAKGKRKAGIVFVKTDRKSMHVKHVIDDRASEFQTIKGAVVTCPIGEYSTPSERVMAQIKVRSGGTNDTYCDYIFQRYL